MDYIAFSTDIYLEEGSCEPAVDPRTIKSSSNYIDIDPLLANKINSFLANTSLSFGRRYTILASRIAMVMLSPLEGYLDGRKTKYIKIVQIGIDHRYQRLGICKKLLEYIKTIGLTYWNDIEIECVNSEHLYNYLDRSSDWKQLSYDRNSFLAVK